MRNQLSTAGLLALSLTAACGYNPLRKTGDSAPGAEVNLSSFPDSTNTDSAKVAASDTGAPDVWNAGGAAAVGGAGGKDARAGTGGDAGTDGPTATGGEGPSATGGTVGTGGTSTTGGAITAGGTTGAGGTGGSDAPTVQNCSALVDPTNGSVSAPETTPGSTAMYACAVGYDLSGVAARTCQGDSTWSGSAPTCNPVNCNAPPSIAAGLVSAPMTTYGSRATYSCAVGYNLSGLARRTCQADGSWSGTAPMCSIQMLTVTINKTGAGAGTVTSASGDISCGSTCAASYAYGTSVLLSATPNANQTFLGWNSAACTGTGSCAFTLTSDTTITASFSPPPNIVFATSTTQTAALGGLSGADTLCAQRAQAAGLAGTYRAWLSTSRASAVSRMGSASGWVRPDGKPVLNNITDILPSRLLYPPRLDEFGNDLGSAGVMTATVQDGTLPTDANETTCGDFTSAVDDGKTIMGGLTSANSEMFTVDQYSSCSSKSRIYCFGIDRTSQVSVTPASGRRAFTGSLNWTPGSGIGSADTQCQSEATAANLPGTYKALLAPSGASAASRFNTDGAPWIRVDGIPLAPTASAFFSASMLDVPPNANADGSYYVGAQGAWSGAATMTTAGADATNCGNWLSSTGTGLIGTVGDTSTARFFGSASPWSGCGGGWLLVCLQE